MQKCDFLSSSARGPYPEKLPVIEASQSSVNQSSDAGDDSEKDDQPPPSYHGIIIQEHMDSDALKYENMKFSNSHIWGL